MKTGDYETVYKDWEKRLSKEASENWLIALKKSISKWQKTADMMDKKLVNEGHLFDVFEDFEIRKDIEQRRALVKQLQELLEKYENFEPKNYLSDECISDLEKLASEKPKLSIHEFFEAAQTQFPSCRKNINGKKIRYRTLMNKTKEVRPDIYYRDIKPRK